MHVYDVYKINKSGYWRVLADTERSAIYEVMKGREPWDKYWAIRVD